MAKNGTNGKILKWSSLILGVLIVGAGIVANFTAHGKDIETNGDHIEGLGTDVKMLDTIVCDPKDGLVVTTAVMRATQEQMKDDIAEINVEQKEFRAEMKSGFAEIKELIKEK